MLEKRVECCSMQESRELNNGLLACVFALLAIANHIAR